MSTPSPVALDEALTELAVARLRAHQRGESQLHADLLSVERWLREHHREASVRAAHPAGAGLGWSADGSP